MATNAHDLKNKTYKQIWEEWNEKFAFGAKGEMSLSEAQNVHRKWRKLGTLASKGLL